MPVTFGPGAWHTRVIGDYVLAYHWVNGEPAMVLSPKRRRMGGGAYIVCLSAAHNYTEMEYLVGAGVRACNTMGVEPTQYAVHRVVDVFLEGLEDLVKMPPDPTPDKRPNLDVTRKNGEIRLEGEIDVPVSGLH